MTIDSDIMNNIRKYYIENEVHLDTGKMTQKELCIYDEEINALCKDTQWRMFLEWNGIIGYDEFLHRAHNAIYAQPDCK